MNIKSGIWPSLTFSFSILLLAPGSHAAEVDFEFVRGPLSQSNFEQAEVAINDNHARISALESQVSALIAMNQTLQNENAALQSQVNDLTSGIVAGLGDYVSVGVDDYGNPAVFYDAVNVYIRSGLNSSTQANGLGNLLIGYNKPIHDLDSSYEREPHCSGDYINFILQQLEVNQENCEAAGYVWSDFHKSGSHNLVVGDGHNYSGASSIVSGQNNAIAGNNVLVTGGRSFSGTNGAVVAGWDNEVKAAGFIASGSHNRTHHLNTAILGGNSNTANGSSSALVGGHSNTANGVNATVIGGANNTAEGNFDILMGEILEDDEL